MPGYGTYVLGGMHREWARDAGLHTNHGKYTHSCPILVHAARHVELCREFETIHGDARRALVALHGARAQQVAERDAKGNLVHGRSHARVRCRGRCFIVSGPRAGAVEKLRGQRSVKRDAKNLRVHVHMRLFSPIFTANLTECRPLEKLGRRVIGVEGSANADGVGHAQCAACAFGGCVFYTPRQRGWAAAQ